ncbi:MAG: putative acyltransferase (DUF342 family) [Motiliproteus sp.]|jgi:predicted acyltransferase (DUF342 family)
MGCTDCFVCIESQSLSVEINIMKLTRQLLFIPLLCVVSSAQADLPPQLTGALGNVVIYSGAAIDVGTGSAVGGNIQVNAAGRFGVGADLGGHIVTGDYVTIGASAKVVSYVTARNAGTVGADATIGGYFTVGDILKLEGTTVVGNIMVGGDVKAGGSIFLGGNSVVSGHLRSGAGAATTLGADSIVVGNVTAGTALTLNERARVGGHAQAGTSAMKLIDNAIVNGSARAGTTITLSAGAKIVGEKTEESIETFTNDPKEPIDDQSPQVAQVQADLAEMAAPVQNQLPASILASKTLIKGVYHATAITTTSAVILTFDGEGVEGHWLINSDSFISFGAETKIVLKDVIPGSTITWNAGSYTFAGERSDLIGTFFAGTYILTGVDATLKGIGGECGGLFTNTGGVTLGATNTIGPRGCMAQPSAAIDHYQIIHDGQGLTCEPETIKIKACTNPVDDDNSCMLSDEEVTVVVKAEGSYSATDRISFIGSGIARISYTVAEQTLLSLNTSIEPTSALVCIDSGTNSCDLVFYNVGFRFLSGDSGLFDNIENQIAGTTFPLRLEAVKSNGDSCQGLFSGDQAINLSQENVEADGSNSLNFSIDGTDIAKHPSVTSIQLNFDADGIATIPTPIYHDAGEIRLHANHKFGGVTIAGDSNTFWVSPAKLVISVKSGTKDLEGGSATATTTHAAGERFNFSVTAFNSLDVITQNYSPGQIQLKLMRTAPTLPGSVDGDLNYAASSWLATSTDAVFQDVTLTDFSSGVSAYAAAHYSEVGLLNLDVQDSSYGNESLVVLAEAINLGRFIPAHFTQTVVQQGLLHTSCNLTKTFTAYSGQREEAANAVGAISYSIKPILAIAAYNEQGDITRNYYNDYMKLSVSGISITAPTSDQTATGVGGIQLPLTANMYPGDLSQYDLMTAEPLDNPLPRGVLHYQLSADDNFFYNRSTNARVSPFTSDMVFSVATITDADSVEEKYTADVSPEGVRILFGRLLLDNSSGPEIYNITQQMRLEYFTSTGFVLNSNDNCTSYDAGKIVITDVSLAPGITSALGGTGNFSAGQTQGIELKAPGDGHQGDVKVLYDAYDWLTYDWDDGDAYDDSPSAVATFGVRKGNDGIIYWTSE